MVRPSLETLFILALIAIAGCESKREAPPLRRCDVAVTMGAGSASATVEAQAAERPEALRRRAIRAGCTRLCASDGQPTACTARCEVDVQAKKAGARVRCTPPLP